MTKILLSSAILMAIASNAIARNGESHDSRCFTKEKIAVPAFKTLARVVGHARVTNAPTKLSDGTVAVAFNDGKIYRLSERGALLDTFDVGDSVESSPVALDAGRLAVGDDSGAISIIDPSKKRNKIRKVRLGGGAIKATPALFSSAKRPLLVVATNSGNVFFVNLRTSKVQEVHKASSGILSSPRVLSDNTALIVASDGEVYRFDEKGKVVNETRIEDEFFASPAVFANGTIVLPSLHGKVYFLSPKLEIVSQAAVGLAVAFYGSPVIIGDFTIAVPSLLSEMYFLNADGSVKSRHRTDLDGLLASPVVMPDGKVVIGGGNHGYLYAFDSERGEVARILIAPTISKSEKRNGIRAAATMLDNGNLVVPTLSGAIYFLRYVSKAGTYTRKVETDCQPSAAPDYSALIEVPQVKEFSIASGKFGENNDQRCYYKEAVPETEIKAGRIFSDSRAAFFEAGPVVTRDGTVVAVTDGGTAHFIKPDGTRHRASLKSIVMATPLALPNGLVVIGTHSGHVAFYDSDAKLISAHAVNHPITASPEALGNDKIGVPAEDGRIHYLDHVGNFLKSSPFYGRFGKGGIAFGGRDTVAFVTGDYYAMIARVSSGKVTKEKQFDYQEDFIARPLILRNGSTAFVAKNSGVHVFDRKNKIIQRYKPDGYLGEFLASPAPLIDDTMVVVTSSGKLGIIDQFGESKAELRIEDEIKISPVVTRKGIIAVVGTKGKVHFVSPHGEYLGMHDLEEEVRVPPTVGLNDEVFVATKNGDIWQLTVENKPSGKLRLIAHDCGNSRGPDSVSTQKKKTQSRKSQRRKQ